MIGVYVAWGEHGCLYVGRSRNVWARLTTHRRERDWNWWADVVEIDVTVLDDEREAERLENETIRELGPRYNVIYNTRPAGIPPGQHEQERDQRALEAAGWRPPQ